MIKLKDIKEGQESQVISESNSMKEAEKVWDALVKTFSDNKNDSIEYLNKDNTYRKIAIREIFRAMNF